MEFPDTFEFLEEFGIKPLEEDTSMAYLRYVKQAKDGGHELDISFSAVVKSFQVVMRYYDQELVTISSEKVQHIKLWRDQSGAGVRVVFDIHGVIAEAVVTLEPELFCHWWTLQA
jgi:hypothetical protein